MTRRRLLKAGGLLALGALAHLSGFVIGYLEGYSRGRADGYGIHGYLGDDEGGHGDDNLGIHDHAWDGHEWL